MKLEMVWPGRGHAIGTLVIPAKTKGIGLQLRSLWGHWTLGRPPEPWPQLQDLWIALRTWGRLSWEA